MEIGKRKVGGITLRLNIPAKEAKGIAPLGPILGQYQINIVKFCKEFNEQSIKFLSGIPLMCIIKKNVSGDYHFFILRPSLNFFFYQIFQIFDKKKNLNIAYIEFLSKLELKENKKNYNINVNLNNLFDIVCIISFFEKKTKKEIAKEVFSCLSSYVYKIKIKC